MATKRNFKTRRKIVKRKKALPKVILIGGAIAGGYLLYKNIIKPYLDSQKNKDFNADLDKTTDSAIQTVVTTASNTTPNVSSSNVTPGLSPFGTPAIQLKLNKNIEFGMKGEEVKQMQTLINASLKNLGKTTRVKMDGIFGDDTWKVHKVISFNAQPLKWWIDLYNETKEQGIDGISWLQGVDVSNSGGFSVGSGYGGQF